MDTIYTALIALALGAVFFFCWYMVDCIRDKRKPVSCKWKGFCNGCFSDENLIKTTYCSECTQYVFIDSGFGWCINNPEPIITAYCRDVCSQYKYKGKK